MKKLILIIISIYATNTNGQYFQRYFGTAGLPTKAHSFYDGLCSRKNFTTSDTTFYNVAVGTAEIVLPDTAGLTKYDEFRFVRTNQQGNTVFINKGYAFKNATDTTNKWFNSIARAACEIDSSNHKGGYISVGAVKSNSYTGSIATGGADALITKIANDGSVKMSFRIDFKNGEDILYSVIPSKSDNSVFYACGTSKFSTNSNLIVLKFNQSGSIIWGYSYRLNVTGSVLKTKATGYSLCENPSGSELLVVGLINDFNNSNSDDGLVAKFNSSTGSYISGSAYHYSTDDQYRVIKPTSTGEYLIGGIISVNAIKCMFMGKANSAGTVYVHKCTLIPINGIIINATCYDAIERKNSTGTIEYYFAGSRNPSPTTSDGVVVKTNFSCEPAAMTHYNSLGSKEAMSLDYSDTTPYSAGIRIFSNQNNVTGLGKIDGYMGRTYFNGATCNVCPGDSFVLFVPTYTISGVTKDTSYSTKTKTKLNSISVNYFSDYLCNQSIVACGSNARNDNHIDIPFSKQFDLVIYPNPASDFITVKLKSENLTGILNLKNNLGQEVLKEEIVSNHDGTNVMLDLSHLPKGVYYLKYASDLNQQTIKLIKY